MRDLMIRKGSMHLRLVGLSCCLIIIGCASTEDFVQYKSGTERKPLGCAIDVYPENVAIERHVEVLAEIGYGESGFSVNCGAETVIAKMKAKACELGADAIRLYNVRYPDASSTCFRASAQLLRYTSKPQQASDGETLVSSGTGWISSFGLIVTNNHVVEGSSNIRVVTASGDEIPVELVVADTTNDIALLRARSHSELPPGLSVSRDQAELGATVFTIGYPHPDFLGKSAKLNVGIISGLTGLQDDPRTYQISIPVQSGNSGGPLLNDRGEVIGVVSYKLNAIAVFNWTGDLTENINFAVKTPYVEALLSGVQGKEPHPSVTAESGGIEFQARRIIDSVVMVVAE